MTKFIEKPTAITPNRELQSDEYFNETDHLIYCSKCNTPRQCRHELQGKVLIPSIRCKCQQEIFEQEEAQRKLHEKQMEIEHLKTSGLQDKALYDYTFARDNGINPEIKLAHNYVSNWEAKIGNSAEEDAAEDDPEKDRNPSKDSCLNSTGDRTGTGDG